MTDPVAVADRIISRVESLHSAPHVARELIRLTSSVEFDMARVVKCIEQDPALVARVLAVANSSRYSPRSRIRSVRQAAGYIGPRSLRLIALTFSMVESLTNGLPAAVYERFWRRAVTVASVSSRLAHDCCKEVAVDDAYTAGLLADVGVLVFAQVETERYSKLAQTAWDGPALLSLEAKQFGIGHDLLGARLLEHWGIAPELCHAVGNHHSRSDWSCPLTLTVGASVLMADAILTPKSDNVTAAKLLLQEAFGIDIDAFIDLALSLEAEIAEAARELSLPKVKSVSARSLVEQARSLFVQASMESAMELDSLAEVFSDSSASVASPHR